MVSKILKRPVLLLILVSTSVFAWAEDSSIEDKVNIVGCTQNSLYCFGDQVETKKGYSGRVQGHFKNGDVQLMFTKESIRVSQEKLSHRTYINPNFILTTEGCNRNQKYCVGSTVTTKKGYTAEVVGFYDKTDVLKLQFKEDIINLHITALEGEQGPEWIKEPGRMIDSIYIKVENIALKGQCQHYQQCYRMFVYVDGVHSATWVTSPGKVHYNEKTAEEEGEFTPVWTNAKISRIEDETYESKSYPRNEDGTRGGAKMPWAIFFKYGGIAIHGSHGAVDGKRHSHGCLRLTPEHAKILNRWVHTVGIDRTFLTTRHTIPEQIDDGKALSCKVNRNGHYQPYNKKKKIFIGYNGHGMSKKNCNASLLNYRKAVCMWNGHRYQPHSVETGRQVGKRDYGFKKISKCFISARASKSSACSWTGKGYQPYSTSNNNFIGRLDFRFSKLDECAKATNASTTRVCNWSPGSVWKVYNARTGQAINNTYYRKMNSCIEASK